MINIDEEVDNNEFGTGYGDNFDYIQKIPYQYSSDMTTSLYNQLTIIACKDLTKWQYMDRGMLLISYVVSPG